jgi:hypothetical protein
MAFSAAELTAIEAACRARADFYNDLAQKADRPIQRNQRLDTAKELLPSRIEFKKIASSGQFVSSLMPLASLGEERSICLIWFGQFVTDATAQGNLAYAQQNSRKSEDPA